MQKRNAELFYDSNKCKDGSSNNKLFFFIIVKVIQQLTYIHL